jgi:preflagellin peptidase FlaK
MTELLPLAISASVILITFLYACWQDIRSRTVFTVTWYPAGVVGGICVLWFWCTVKPDFLMIWVLLLSVLVAVMMAWFAKLGMFGWADAKAMILLSLTVPVTPFAAWVFPSLALSALFNAGIIALAVPVCIFLKNVLNHEHAPFWLMFSGTPVPGDEITGYFGFVAEEISEDENGISRTFLPAKSSIHALQCNTELSLRKLRENPEEYRYELDLYCRAGKVWVTYGIPFMIPITLGYILALSGLGLPDLILGLLI